MHSIRRDPDNTNATSRYRLPFFGDHEAAGSATEEVDRAITLFERGRTEEAARRLAVVRRSAVDANDEEGLAEIDEAIRQMQAYLSAGAREAFDIALADETAGTQPHRPLRRGELRSIIESAGVVASAGAVVILVSALFRWPDTLLYALLLAVAGPLLIVMLSLPVTFVNSLRPRMSGRRKKRKQVAPS